MSQDKKFETIYEKLLFYYIGGLWGYTIMRIRDPNGKFSW